MKVHELIEELKLYPENMEIYTASDEEGNDINNLYFVTPEFMNEFGEIVHEDDLYKDDYRESVLVIYP